MDEDKSITKKIEILDIIHPNRSLEPHKVWLEQSIIRLQKEFDENNDLSVQDKTKIFTLVSGYIREQESNPIRIIEAIRQLPEHKARLVIGMLEKENIIKALKKKTKDSLFS